MKKGESGVKNGSGYQGNFKRSLLQSQDFAASVRRHSVYGQQSGNQEFGEGFSVRVSSKEMKSLQKYKSTGRP